MTTTIRFTTVAVLLVAAVTVASAQQPQQPGRPQKPNPMGGKQGPKNSAPNDPMSPVYVQQMFDAMAIMEAERFLPLTTEQYPLFVQKLRRLQETKMQSNRRRTKALSELRALVGPQAPPDVPDSVIDAKLKELAGAELDGLAGVHKALDDLDTGLSVRQRARYRLLEETVERRKIDFLTKVRGGGPAFEGSPQ